jgi:hypothetical protein
MNTLPPIRHVTATSAVKLLRNAVVTSWAHASIILFAIEFRLRHWGHIVHGWNLERERPLNQMELPDRSLSFQENHREHGKEGVP